jgi:hypothetical protein
MTITTDDVLTDEEFGKEVGMSMNKIKRERIATAALHGLLASGAEGYDDASGEHYILAFLPIEAAERAVTLADALIAELDK